MYEDGGKGTGRKGRETEGSEDGRGDMREK